LNSVIAYRCFLRKCEGVLTCEASFFFLIRGKRVFMLANVYFTYYQSLYQQYLLAGDKCGTSRTRRVSNNGWKWWWTWRTKIKTLCGIFGEMPCTHSDSSFAE